MLQPSRFPAITYNSTSHTYAPLCPSSIFALDRVLYRVSLSRIGPTRPTPTDTSSIERHKANRETRDLRVFSRLVRHVPLDRYVLIGRFAYSPGTISSKTGSANGIRGKGNIDNRTTSSFEPIYRCRLRTRKRKSSDDESRGERERTREWSSCVR